MRVLAALRSSHLSAPFPSPARICASIKVLYIKLLGRRYPEAFDAPLAVKILAELPTANLLFTSWPKSCVPKTIWRAVQVDPPFSLSPDARETDRNRFSLESRMNFITDSLRVRCSEVWKTNYSYCSSALFVSEVRRFKTCEQRHPKSGLLYYVLLFRDYECYRHREVHEKVIRNWLPISRQLADRVSGSRSVF